MSEKEATYRELINECQKLQKELESYRRYNELIEASEAKVNSLINNQDASIWSIDTNYNYVVLNNFFIKAYKEAFGIDLQKGTSALSILPPELARYWKEKYDIALTGQKTDFEFTNTNNGIESIYQVSLNPVLTNNKVTGVSALSIDISNQKQVETALAENNTNMLAIMDNTLESIWAIDTNYNILFTNSVFKSEFHKSFGVELIRGNNLLEALPEVLKPVWKPRYDRALNNERFSFIDEIDTGKQVYYVEVSMNPILSNNQVIGTSFFANNITQRIVAQKALKESEKQLQELNRTKDKFFSIIAHDLRSPFNSILGLSDLLVSKAIDKGDIEETARSIQKSSQQAMALISNLLEWSSSQSGKIDYKPNTLDICDVLNEELKALEANYKQKDIAIKKSIPETTQVFADRYMIGSVFRNLLSNAIKFTDKKGHIELSCHPNKTHITFTIKDNGIGIAEDNIPKLFRIDQNLSTQGTHNEQGTGLGLSLCKEFIEMHGGQIWAESELNKGSAFYFTLPLYS
ncbi:PAS domain-containing sensor histidine kinase [Carboxylicivirga sediminis]|uniref:histidine kinase n=1 Tax=Carboxylicivirga sediminis TaxID=2006564 RepID=A0A941F0S3_9BACT|nr:PAS domain-containing sensor histidine kinase [Carboxylicivirga sediminis]MBR8534184.1 PAS domain-containing sensor histidine kinase [Carboxylicivirga sediminis]